MIILSARQNEEAEIHEVRTFFSEFQSQLNTWKALCWKSAKHREMEIIDRIMNWLPSIARIHVGYKQRVEYTEITFYNHSPSPFGQPREGESIKFYETGLEYLIYDIVMGTRALNDGLDMKDAVIKVPEEEREIPYEKELLVVHEGAELFSMYTKDSINSRWEMPVKKAMFTLSYTLYDRVRRYYDRGYTKVVFADRRKADEILKEEK